LDADGDRRRAIEGVRSVDLAARLRDRARRQGARRRTQPDARAARRHRARRNEGIGELELRGATLYSTLQPCGMCTMASIWSKVGRVVFGAGRDDVHPMYFEARHVDTLAFIADAYRDDIEIEGGCLADECAELYYGPDADLPKEEQANL
jgi:tRNA(adenine34) deaminase